MFKQKNNRYLVGLLALYFAATFFTLTIWTLQDRFSVTGDEPHYLVMAAGFARHRTFEQTLPYKEEFQSRKIYKPGLAATDAEPSPSNTHAVSGTHGLYNVHNIGLPLLLTLPFLIGGVIGAKIFMVLLSGLTVAVAWKISALFSDSPKIRFIAVAALTTGLPMIPASNQIYPDLIAGLICLNGIYWLLTLDKKRSILPELFYSTSIAFLSWLQVKLAAVELLLLLSVISQILIKTKNVRRAIWISLPALLLGVVLAAYNFYAFGKASGPYLDGALELSKTAIMVLLGLHFDQNQGFLLQNPIFMLGLAAIGPLFVFNRWAGITWLLAFIALILPNALHPNWYGGGSFSGRFAWSAAIVFMIPTILGTCQLASTNQFAFRAIVGLGIFLQLGFFAKYTLLQTSLYNQSSSNTIEAYSEFYFPVQRWFPALYNVEWAYHYVPNYVFLILTLSLLAIGFAIALNLTPYWTRLLRKFFAVSVVAVFVGGIIPEPYNLAIFPLTFSAASLPSQAGRLDGSSRVAEEGIDKPGFLSFGPFILLHKGVYQVEFRYISNAPTGKSLGRWDIYAPRFGLPQVAGEIFGTNGSLKSVVVPFTVESRMPRRYEFRSFWNGSADLRIIEIRLEQSNASHKNTAISDEAQAKASTMQKDFEVLAALKTQQIGSYTTQLTAHPIAVSNEYDFRSNNLFFLGWSHKEALFRWSEGHHAELLFYLAPDSPLPKTVDFTVVAYQHQNFRVSLNGLTLGDFVLENAEQTLSLTIDPSFFVPGAVNTLHFNLPDAHKPSNGDPRVLALAFKKIKMI